MEFKILAPGASEVRFDNLLTGYKGLVIPGSYHSTASSEFGKMYFQNHKGNGFEIWFSNYSFLHPVELTGRADIPVLELHMQFLNSFINNWDGLGERELLPNQYGITYTPFLLNNVKFIGGREYQTFDVHFSISYLQKLAPEFPVLDKFLNTIIKGQPASISQIPRFLTPDMITIVGQVLRCPFTSGAAGIYVESKVIELLLLVLDQLSGNHPLAPVRLTPYDIEQLHEAKKLIVKDYDNLLSIKELSRKVAINEFKLKKGFKYLFGTTIFDYIQRNRMEEARLLLLETDLPIHDIAFRSGYEYPANFNKAFKKHFGYTAAYLRRHKKL